MPHKCLGLELVDLKVYWLFSSGAELHRWFEFFLLAGSYLLFELKQSHCKGYSPFLRMFLRLSGLSGLFRFIYGFLRRFFCFEAFVLCVMGGFDSSPERSSEVIN